LPTNTIKFEHSDFYIYLVEDNVSQRESIESILNFIGYNISSFSNANAFLKNKIQRPGVLVTDMQMPDISGVELQEQLLQLNIDIPIIFISGEASISQSIKAMQQGAIDFLVKPFDADQLIQVVKKACGLDAKKIYLKELLETLSPRELEVYKLLNEGLNNNELIDKLKLSLPTVKQYKSEVMRKLKIKTLSELIHLSR
jgi:FixJ family two-component response regulator